MFLVTPILLSADALGQCSHGVVGSRLRVDAGWLVQTRIGEQITSSNQALTIAQSVRASVMKTGDI